MAGIDERMDAQKLGDKAGTTAAVTGDRIADAASQAGVVAQEQMDRLAETIKRNPMQAAGIAAGIGFVLALLARR